MALTPRTRQIVLGTTLAATLIAVAWQYAQPQSEPADAVVAPVKSKTAQQSFTQSTPHLALDKLQRADDVQVDRIKDAFQAQSWAPPPPPPAPPAPPPPPSPPPLPFTYMGQLVEDGTLTVFLSRQDQNYAVKAGDSLDGTYRVDKVENRRLVLTYLPLNMQQSLAIGSVN
ncbi:hypothetical protein [Sulfuriferula sp.]|uniref:hypothetical protein n=1 Tax=Sulfuriferula sp. TaxID=2025307 RepID=UPI002731A7B6|nr:hypothetical protein [Sulfuriferula sp.]MDP2027466.1 hypothetical protein [Sulfuriferula sp.]